MKNGIRWYLFLFFISTITLTNAQKVSLKWGEEFTEKGAEKYDNILYNDENYIYLPFSNRDFSDLKSLDYKWRNEKLGHLSTQIKPGIIKLDKNLKEVTRVEFDSVELKDAYFNALFYLDEKFVMILSQYNSKSSTTEIYGVLIDKKTLKIIGVPKLIWSLPKYCFKDIPVRTHFRYAVSTDSTSFVLTKIDEQVEKKIRSLNS